MTKRILLFIVVWMLTGPFALQAQDLNRALTMQNREAPSDQMISLEESLNHLEDKYEVTFIYKTHLVENKQVLLNQLRADDLSMALHQLLYPHHLQYEQIGARYFTILQKPTEQEEADMYQESVNGTVRDIQTGESLPGVNVLVKGTDMGTSTGSDGTYELRVPSLQDTLIFSYIGYRLHEVPIQGQSVIDVNLEPEAITGDELVVIGYGTQARADLTGAVSTVDLDRTLRARPVTDLGRGLQGSVAGLTITTPTGDLGTSPSITLRGIRGSLNTGSEGARPLILVDNVEIENLNMVNPDNIESISILKDAASTAIYGTRAAWGAILITTKSGRFETQPRVSYSNNFSMSTPTNKLEIAPAVEGTEMAFAALQRRSPSINVFGVVGMFFDETAIQKIREWEELYGGQNLGNEMVMGRDFEIRDGRLFFYRPWDAAEMYLKDWTPMQKHDLNISGGSERISYNLGVGYTGQTGVLKVNPDSWDRYNVNLSLNSDVNNWLDARGNIMWSRTDLSTPYNFYSATYDYWYYLYRWPATYPYGTYEGRPFRNPATEVEQANMGDDSQNLTRLTLGGTATLAEGLTIDADFTYANWNRHLHQTGGAVEGYNFWAGGGNLNYTPYTTAVHDRVQYTTDWSRRNNFRSYTTWRNDLENHSFTLMGGFDLELFEEWRQYSERRNLLDPSKGELGLSTGDQFVSGYHRHWSTAGFFGRINYSFRDKYLIQLNARMDGSSRFPTDDQWAFFPSVSAGYVISRESFMDFARPALSFFKIRGSWGTVGNQNVGTNAFLPVMTRPTNASWWDSGSGSIEQTFNAPRAVSESLTWEKVTTLDIGFDAGIFDDRVLFTFDWYVRTTSNMLSAGVTLPSTFGAASPQRNFGEMQTKGWELEARWNHVMSNDFHFHISGTLSDFQEKITRYPDITNTIPNPIAGRNNNYYQGMTIGEIWGYETVGFFTEDDFVQDAGGNLVTDENGRYILKDGIASQELFEEGWFFYGPGDIRYRDLDGDGEITFGSNTVDDPGDMRIIGNSTPRYQYGVNLGGGWRGIDFNVFLQGVGKRDYWADGPIFIPGYRPGEAWYTHQTDYWTPDNPNAYYPRPTDQTQSNSIRNFRPQTRYLLDLSYLRLKNVTIGYSLPAGLLERIAFTQFRVYLSGENLFEFTNLDLPIDPEVDYTTPGLNDTNTFGRVYPFRRSLSVGVEISF